jgi:hypothetical protein
MSSQGAVKSHKPLAQTKWPCFIWPRRKFIFGVVCAPHPAVTTGSPCMLAGPCPRQLVGGMCLVHARWAKGEPPSKSARPGTGEMVPCPTFLIPLCAVGLGRRSSRSSPCRRMPGLRKSREEITLRDLHQQSLSSIQRRSPAVAFGMWAPSP